MATARSMRVILTGSLPSGAFLGEIWQTGMSFVEGDGGGVFPDAIKETLPQFAVTVIGEASADATWDIDWAWKGDTKVTQTSQLGIANAALAMFNALKGQFTARSRLDGVKIVAQDENGKVINGANYFTLKTAVAGTSTASATIPPQLAVVASLRTGARGPGGRGRMYWPLNTSLGTDGLVSATAVTLLKNQVKTFAEAVRAIGPLASVVNVGPRTYSSLKTVEVGNMYDSQRRRKNALRETYESVAVSL